MRIRSAFVPMLSVVLVGLALVAPGTAVGATDAVAGQGPGPGPVTAFDLSVDEGVPVLRVRQGEQVWDPADVVLRADGERAALALPSSLPSRYSGLLTPGSTVYEMPGTPTADLPSLGWGAPVLGAGASATLRLAVTGPGRVLVATDHGERRPLDVHLDSSRPEPAVIVLPSGTVATPTWIVDRPGAYTFTATPVVAAPDGSVVEGATASYRLDVSEPVTPTPTATPVPSPSPTPTPPPAPTPDPVAAAAAAAAPSAATAADRCAVPGLAAGAMTATTGHFDFGVQVDGGTLRSRVKDDQTSPATWRDPSSVLFQLGDTARTTVPPGDAYAFLGEPDATVWTIGQTQQDGVPWLGWNTQHASAVQAIDGPTTWTLDAVDGPGDVFVYQTGSFGALTRVFGTGDGWPRSRRVPANVHGHGNWSFTRPGIYRITTTHAATLTSGRQVSSTATLLVQVGPCAEADPRPDSPLAAGQLLAEGALAKTPRHGVVVEPRRTTAGATVSLRVPELQPGSWLMPVAYSAPKQLGWAQVSATRELPTVTLPARLAEGRHRVAVYDASGAVQGWAPVVVTAAEDEADPNPVTPADGGETVDPAPAAPSATGSGLSGTGGTSLRAAAACVPAPATPTAPSGAEPPGTAPGVGAPAAANAEKVTDGHLDFGAHVVGGALVPKVKDDRQQPSAWVDPASVRLVLGSSAEQQVPGDPSYSFMGKPGDTVWMMPQTQVADVPWLGWNTQDESVRSQVDGSVRFTLDSVSGPGKLAVYLTDSFGGIGEKTFGNAAGFPSSFDVPVNVHAHGNWVFTAAGTYAVTITQTAKLTSGASVSGTATLAFTVGGSGASRVLPRLAPGFATAQPSQPAAPTAPTAPTAASLADCVLPETGAPRHSAPLLALGGLLVLAGATVLVRSRRRA
ncbi:TIGR03773 family transporter-associated surface protein [Nocardioides sp. W7]|uniref:TIGR03773 family transporter-associated surface protein n=1 Tax=Nocardioides sp. W7 TaxID=2931390 RepID=UPI001FD318AF|nr:TIGR03773 family transporter-associated surface protein [Nocardioides sp. W7]